MTAIRVLSILTILLASTTAAQAQSDAGRSAGRRPARQADPDRFVQRIMQSDTDKDGRLSRDELAGGRFVAVFDQADANGDGYLEPKEITLFMATSGGTDGESGAIKLPENTGPSEQAFMHAMEQAGRALMGLRRTSFKATSFDRDMKMLQDLESNLIEARRHVSAVPMSDAAKEKFGSNQAAYQRSFQMHMVTSLIETLEVEMAILQGDPAKAKEGVAALLKTANESHQLF